ncbi:unnamed protein product [Peniophora sp. CBMAI 1063]|nr:unnamed protein product [Peniophora sp. CBMAI 1063]
MNEYLPPLPVRDLPSNPSPYVPENTPGHSRSSSAAMVPVQSSRRVLPGLGGYGLPVGPSAHRHMHSSPHAISVHPPSRRPSPAPSARQQHLSPGELTASESRPLSGASDSTSFNWWPLPGDEEGARAWARIPVMSEKSFAGWLCCCSSRLDNNVALREAREGPQSFMWTSKAEVARHVYGKRAYWAGPRAFVPEYGLKESAYDKAYDCAFEHYAHEAKKDKRDVHPSLSLCFTRVDLHLQDEAPAYEPEYEPQYHQSIRHWSLTTSPSTNLNTSLDTRPSTRSPPTRQRPSRFVSQSSSPSASLIAEVLSATNSCYSDSQYVPAPVSNCNKGDLRCCNQVQPANPIGCGQVAISGVYKLIPNILRRLQCSRWSCVLAHQQSIQQRAVQSADGLLRRRPLPSSPSTVTPPTGAARSQASSKRIGFAERTL